MEKCYCPSPESLYKLDFSCDMNHRFDFPPLKGELIIGKKFIYKNGSKRGRIIKRYNDSYLVKLMVGNKKLITIKK